MERHEEPGRFPDLCNAVDIHTLLCLARIMLRDKPCVFPTADARMSIPVAAANSLASSVVVKVKPCGASS